MEFVDGHTLRDLMRDRQTGLAKLLRHLQHAAEGLAKAHAAGIVHRELNLVIDKLRDLAKTRYVRTYWLACI